MKFIHKGKEFWAYEIFIGDIVVGDVTWSHDRNCWVLQARDYLDSPINFEGFDLKQLKEIVSKIPKLKKEV